MLSSSRSRRWRAAAAGVVAAVLSGPALSSPASADNDVVITRPLAGERLDERPDAVTVVLTDPAQGDTLLAIEAADGRDVSVGPARVVSTNLATQVPPDLEPGIYTVTFRTDTPRGPEGGSFQFAYRSSESMSIDGVDRWRGYSDIPDVVAQPGDDEAAAAAATTEGETPTPNPSDSPDAESSTAPDADDATSAGAESDRPDDSTTSWLPWTLALVVPVGALAWLLIRRRESGESTEV